MKSEKYTLAHLEALYSEITQAKDSPSAAKFPELLERLSKLLIWGDRNDSGFFEYFCEVRALDLLLEVFSKAREKEIVIGVIGFFNMLWTNLTRKETINCLLSHPCILSLQNIKFVALDNEIAEYYINFLKGLSRKLDTNSFHLFMNKRYPSFPLLMQATRFYNHPEGLVRTTCRNIIMTCIKLEDPKMRQFASGFPFCTYYIHECNFLKEYWSILDNVIELEGEKQFELQNLEVTIQDHEEILLFIDDFMHIHPNLIAGCFIDAFANECMAPLMQALYSHNKVNFGISTVLYVASTLVKVISNNAFVDFIVLCLLGKYYSQSFEAKLMAPVERPISYSKQWKFKGFWDSHQAAVNAYCVNTYFPSEKKIVSDVYAQEEPKVTKKYSSEVRSIFGMGTNFYEREADKLENIFGLPIISDPQTFKKKSASSAFHQLMQSISDGTFSKEDCQPNPVRDNLFSYLKAKDDTLVNLTLHLFLTIFNRKSLSPELLEFCCLSIRPTSYNFSTVIDIETILKNCLEMLAIQHPPFRICTYTQSLKLIEHTSQIFRGQANKIPPEVLAISKQALKTCIARVDTYLYAGKDWEKYIGIFNKVTNEQGKNRFTTLYTFGLRQRDEAERKKAQNHEIYEIFALTELQVVARDFWLYLIARDAYCAVTKTSYKYEITKSDEEAEKKASRFEIDSPYEIEQDHRVDAMLRRPNQDAPEKCSLIFLGGFLVIGMGNCVKYKAGYEECIMVMDRSDPRKVMLEMGAKVFIVELENAKQSYELRRHFEDMKSTMFKYQLSMLVKQTEWLLQQVSES